jgi:HTH-type transcriptional regulator/antitoxin HigA
MIEAKMYEYRPEHTIPPGVTLAETLDSLGMTQKDFADRCGRPLKTINEIIKGKASITPRTALEFERVLGIPASFWNNLERNYQDALAREEERKQLHTKTSWLGRFPVRGMIDLGWIPQCDDEVEQTRAVLSFFGIASPDQWQEIFAGVQVAYRQSPTFASQPGAVAAWLRRGDLEGVRITCGTFNKAEFTSSLDVARRLTCEPDPKVFIPEIQKSCAAAGVAVTFVPELPGLRVSGAARWLLSTKALIQLNLRYKTNDHLWFSFFHECGHVLLDAKRDSFLDEEKGKSKDVDPRETRANKFAADTLIPQSEYDHFRQKGQFTDVAIRSFAHHIGIAPGIVVGRLQHDGLVRWQSRLNSLKESYCWGD